MNWFQFGRLIHSIYGRPNKLPDLAWIESLGLLAVKLAQVHALRVDFLPREKCEHLARLYRRNSALPPGDFEQLLAASAPPGFIGEFSRIEPAALATASVGQVHRATMKNGEHVVIKAVKRQARAQFERDVESLEQLFRLILFAYPKLGRVGNPLGILEDIRAYTLSELDLRSEISGQEELRNVQEKFGAQFDLSVLAFPKIYRRLGNQNVLVSEYIPGRSFDELLSAGELTYAQLLQLFRAQGFYIFCAGAFHGDLHPGNVLLHEGKLHLIDTGYIGTVGPKIRLGLGDFFTALADYDYPRCAAALNRMSEVEIGGSAYAQFEKAFLALYANFTGATAAQVSLTRQMMQTIKLGVHSGMDFERGIFGVIRSLMYLDGMVLRCHPNAVLLPDMKPFIQEFQSYR